MRLSIRWFRNIIRAVFLAVSLRQKETENVAPAVKKVRVRCRVGRLVAPSLIAGNLDDAVS